MLNVKLITFDTQILGAGTFALVVFNTDILKYKDFGFTDPLFSGIFDFTNPPINTLFWLH